MALFARTALIDPTDIIDGGDVGGDIQRSDAPCSRLVFRDETTGEFLVQDTYVYAIGLNGVGTVLYYGDEGVASFAVEISVHETYCTDYTDPGSSETNSNCIYRRGEGTYAAMPSTKELIAELKSWLAMNVEESIDSDER